MTPSELISLAMGIGGLAVASLTLILNHRARVAPYRQTLYNKQLEGYVEIVNVVSEWHNVAQNFIVTNHCVLNGDEIRITIRKHSAQLIHKTSETHIKWFLFMPEEMNEAVAAFFKVFNAITAPSLLARQYPADLVGSNDPGMELHKAHSRIIQIARKGIGTDPLSEGVLKTVGNTTNEGENEIG